MVFPVSDDNTGRTRTPDRSAYRLAAGVTF